MDYKAIKASIEPFKNRKLGENKKEAVLTELYLLACKYLGEATYEEQKDTCIELQHAMTAIKMRRDEIESAEAQKKREEGDKWAIEKIKRESLRQSEKWEFIDFGYETAVDRNYNHYK